MPENQLFLGGFFCYLAAAVSFLAAFWLQAGRATRWGIIFFALAFVGHSLTVGVRWLAGGGCFSSIYEFILLFSWVLTALFLLAGGKFRIWPAGVVVAPCQVGLLSYAVTVRHAVQPLVPALQSGWLVFHVAAAVLAYACFTLGAGFAGVDLWRRDSRMAATGLI
ncbi:MAG: cytochrome c biogenesis protein CcsA, partial [Heliobacteriaceae bacterium]|nr:cytochrome c biogenesis protein CcsA [Heliobacteriaceae bacterium]